MPKRLHGRLSLPAGLKTKSDYMKIKIIDLTNGSEISQTLEDTMPIKIARLVTNGAKIECFHLPWIEGIIKRAGFKRDIDYKVEQV